MANTIEVIIKAIDQASKVIAGIETKATTSAAAMVKGFEDVGVSSGAVNKRLEEYGAAVNGVARVQNQLKQAQLDAVDAAQKLAQAQKNLAENTDPSRTAELNRELINAQVNLDKAGKEVQDLSTKLRTGKADTDGMASGFSKMQAAIVTVNQGIDLFQRAVSTVGSVLNETVGKTVAYDKSIRDLAQNLGITTEETSRIVQAADDFTVSQEAITAALQMAVKRGYAPTVETIANLADQYVSIQDPIKRAALMVDTFGRGWTALTPMLKEGGAAIRAQAAAIESGLIVTSNSAKASRDYEIALDGLNDRVEALKINVGRGLIPVLTTLMDNQNSWNTVWDENAAVTERVKAIDYTLGHDVWPWEVKQLQDLREAILAVAKAKKEWGVGFIESSSINAAKDLGKAIDQVALANRQAASSGQDLIDYITAEEAGMKRAADASQALANANLALLKVGVSGQLANESKQFASSQADLQKRLKETADELRDLESKQGAVNKTTVKNAMSTNELTLANARLVDMQKRLSKETDPAKQAELAAQIGIQQDKINGANQAVSSYIDNSKRISELKGTYDEINAEIETNAKAHEEANKRILFDYAQQAIAQQNARDGITAMTATQVDALNKLAVTWGIKSQADVDAMNQMLLAAKQLASDNSLDEFGAIAQGALEGPKKPTDDLIKLMQGLQKEASDKMGKVGAAIDKTKTPVKSLKTNIDETKSAMNDWGNTLDTLTVRHVAPLTNGIEGLNLAFRGLKYALADLPATIPFFNLPNPATLVPPTPGPASTPGGTRTYPLEGGAQYGADFIVPPNPRGGAGDYFPLRVAPGERVQVTPQGQRGGMAGLNIGTVNINVRDTNASVQQIQQAVWTEMTRVIEAAQR